MHQTVASYTWRVTRRRAEQFACQKIYHGEIRNRLQKPFVDVRHIRASELNDIVVDKCAHPSAPDKCRSVDVHVPLSFCRGRKRSTSVCCAS